MKKKKGDGSNGVAIFFKRTTYSLCNSQLKYMFFFFAKRFFSRCKLNSKGCMSYFLLQNALFLHMPGQTIFLSQKMTFP